MLLLLFLFLQLGLSGSFADGQVLCDRWNQKYNVHQSCYSGIRPFADAEGWVFVKTNCSRVYKCHVCICVVFVQLRCNNGCLSVNHIRQLSYFSGYHLLCILEPPPSYDSLYGQVRAAKAESSSIADFLKKFCIIIFSTSKHCVFLILPFPHLPSCRIYQNWFKLIYALVKMAIQFAVQRFSLGVLFLLNEYLTNVEVKLMLSWLMSRHHYYCMP